MTHVVLLLKIILLLMIRSLVMKSNIILWFPSRWVLINAKFRGTSFGDLLRVVYLKKWVQSIICFEIWLFYLFMMFFLQTIAEIVPLRIWLCHSRNLRLWNGKKSLQGIWQHFSCLLDKGITEISKKLNSHGGFLSYHLDSKANSAQRAACFCTC